MDTVWMASDPLAALAQRVMIFRQQLDNCRSQHY
jgi:hypothetical protein